MIVVSDTTPLNYLILTETDHVLPAIFGRIYVPAAVIKMADDFLLESMKAATEEWRKVAPEERFESLVRSGVIDREGKLLRHLPQPSEDPARIANGDVEDSFAAPETAKSAPEGSNVG